MTPAQEMGLLVEGFDEAPAVDMVYTAPYYPQLLHAAGLRPVYPMRTLRVDDISRIDPNSLLGPREQRLLASGRLRIRGVNARRLDAEIELIHSLAVEAFARHRYFVPPTLEEFDFQVAPFRRLLDLDLALIAELEGEPCGFVI